MFSFNLQRFTKFKSIKEGTITDGLPIASTDEAGVVQLGGGTINYYRADGKWERPPDLDEKMTQNVSTTDNTYNILMTATPNATAGLGAATAIFGSGIKANPNKSLISATTFSGNATSATKLQTARALQVSLNNTTKSTTFNGENDVSDIKVAGTLQIANGGSGITVQPSLITNLSSSVSAGAFQANPKPGVTGILPILNGGTGQTTAAGIRNAIGLGNTTGVLSVANGGTGQSTEAGIKEMLGFVSSSGGADILSVEKGGTGQTVLSAVSVGSATKATQDGSGRVISDTYVPVTLSPIATVQSANVAGAGSPGILANDIKNFSSVRSGLYTENLSGMPVTTNPWYNVINIRHRNGISDGNQYGTLIYAPMAAEGDLAWRQQIGSSWKNPKTIIDTSNLNSYDPGRRCVVGLSGNDITKPWFKVASCQLTGKHKDATINFLVENIFGTRLVGILNIHIRTGESITFTNDECNIQWLANPGFTLSDFVLVLPTDTSPTAELWTRVYSTWGCRNFLVLSEGTANSNEKVWTLYPSYVEQSNSDITTVGTRKTSVNMTLQNTASGGIVPVANGGTNATSAVAARNNLGLGAVATQDTLAVANGGTAITVNPSMLINLGSSVAAGVFAATPRPGVTGILSQNNGGTGATTAQNARKQLFPDNMNSADKALYVYTLNNDYVNSGYTTIQNLRNFMGLGNTKGALPIENGGTNATTAAAARTNLGLGSVATVNIVPVSLGGTGQTVAAAVTVGCVSNGRTSAVTWNDALKPNKALVNSTATDFGAIWNATTKNYRVGLATWGQSDDCVRLLSMKTASVNGGSNNYNAIMYWDADTGILAATGFSGNLTGNVTGTATRATGDKNGADITTTYLTTVSAANDYLKKTDAANTYLGKNATAAAATTVTQKYTRTGVGTLDWGTNNNYLLDKAAIAWWNGAHSGTSSNLAYCNKGAFGTMVTVNSPVPIANGGTGTTTEVDIYNVIQRAKSCVIYQNGSPFRPWFKAITITLNGSWKDASLLLSVKKTTRDGSSGIFVVHVSTNATVPDTGIIQCLINNGLDLSHFKIKVPTTWANPFEIWVYHNAAHSGTKISVLDSSTTRTNGSFTDSYRWIVSPNQNQDDTKAAISEANDPYTKSTIPTDGTICSVDLKGTTATAATAAAATKATQDGSGNTITTTYVNLTDTQTITGAKHFDNKIYFGDTVSASNYIYFNRPLQIADDVKIRLGTSNGHGFLKSLVTDSPTTGSVIMLQSGQSMMIAAGDQFENVWNTYGGLPSTQNSAWTLPTQAELTAKENLFLAADGYIKFMTNLNHYNRFYQFSMNRSGVFEAPTVMTKNLIGNVTLSPYDSLSAPVSSDSENASILSSSMIISDSIITNYSIDSVTGISGTNIIGSTFVVPKYSKIQLGNHWVGGLYPLEDYYSVNKGDTSGTLQPRGSVVMLSSGQSLILSAGEAGIDFWNSNGTISNDKCASYSVPSQDALRKAERMFLVSDNDIVFYVTVDETPKRFWMKNTGVFEAPTLSGALAASHITGTLPVEHGGTGATVAATARTNLGLGSVATMSTIPVANGGTGATIAATARTNLMIGGTNWVADANCTTKAATAEKVITVTGLTSLIKGTIIYFVLNTANTATTPKVKVNSFTAHTVFINRGISQQLKGASMKAGSYTIIYNGASFDLLQYPT